MHDISATRVRIAAAAAAGLALLAAATVASAQQPPGKPNATPATPKPQAPATSPHATPPKPAHPKSTTPALPPAPARLWLIAPTLDGKWTFRIDNVGEAPLRVPADVRLLRFEIETVEKKRKKTVKCAAPPSLRPDAFPEDRALYLAPGQSYIEEFDPKLLCFGKDAAALEGGALVRTRFGWNPPAKWSTKPPSPPFAAQGTENPPRFAATNELLAPSIVLGYARHAATAADAPADKGDKKDAKTDKPADKSDTKADKPADKKDTKGDKKDAKTDKPADKKDAKTGKPGDGKPANAPSIVDANAARFEVTQAAFADASEPRRASITVTAENGGQRPAIAAVRPRMLSFKVDGPNGLSTCDAAAPTHAIPRDLYRTLKPKDKVAMTILLSEVCPKGTFPRPGLYRVTATLEAGETGEEANVDALTGTATASAPTLLRLNSAPERFYAEPPKAVPTPKPEESPGD